MERILELTEFFLGVFAGVHLVVTRDIFVERSEHNHRDHSAEEKHDHQRVEDGEPLDVRVRHRLEDVVPSRRPLDRVVLDEAHRVSVDDVDRLSAAQRSRRDFQGLLARAVRLAGIVLDRPRRDLHRNNPASVLLERISPLLALAAAKSALELKYSVKVSILEKYGVQVSR